MTIATALDHLTDVLAGEDVAAEQTIEQSVNKIADMIESGEITIGGGGSSNIIVIHYNPDTFITDITWQEAHDAMAAGKVVVMPIEQGGVIALFYAVEASTSDGYQLLMQAGSKSWTWYADTADGYLYGD